jgi:hypothetical protein
LNSKPFGGAQIVGNAVWVEIVPAAKVKVVNSSAVKQPLARKVLTSLS